MTIFLYGFSRLLLIDSTNMITIAQITIQGKLIKAAKFKSVGLRVFFLKKNIAATNHVIEPELLQMSNICFI